MKFIGYLVYSMILTGLIYPISGYWKWGGGTLAQWGVPGLCRIRCRPRCRRICRAGRRIGTGSADWKIHTRGQIGPMPGHNITFAALGVFILWVGWYGFNPGSQLTYNGAVNAEATTYIALTTTIAAAAGAISAMVCSWGKFGKPDITMALNGALAGLVGITANCDRVSQNGSARDWSGRRTGRVCRHPGSRQAEDRRPRLVLLPRAWVLRHLGRVGARHLRGHPEGLASRGEFFMVQLKSTAIICAWAFATHADRLLRTEGSRSAPRSLPKKNSAAWTSPNTAWRPTPSPSALSGLSLGCVFP